MKMLYLNDKPIETTESFTLEKILFEQGYTQPDFAVAINRHFIPRSNYHATQVANGDRIEIILPMQGG